VFSADVINDLSATSDPCYSTGSSSTNPVFVGPSAPKGYEKNHTKTVGTDGWFIYFRLYAPAQPFFDKTFKLADFERID
jgi:hypothetical protein